MSQPANKQPQNKDEAARAPEDGDPKESGRVRGRVADQQPTRSTSSGKSKDSSGSAPESGRADARP